jgi:hypothetical protein
MNVDKRERERETLEAGSFFLRRGIIQGLLDSFSVS